MQTNFIIGCSVRGNCFLLEVCQDVTENVQEEVRVMILEDQCWTEADRSVAAASQHNTYTKSRTGPPVTPSLPNRKRGSPKRHPSLGGPADTPQMAADCTTVQHRPSRFTAAGKDSRSLQLLCGTPGMSGPVPASAVHQRSGRQSCSTLQVDYLDARTWHARFLCNFVFK